MTTSAVWSIPLVVRLAKEHFLRCFLRNFGIADSSFERDYSSIGATVGPTNMDSPASANKLEDFVLELLR